LKWQFSAGAAVQTGILFVPGSETTDDVIYFGSDDGHVYCVAAGNGSMQWKSDDQFGPLVATPVIATWNAPSLSYNLTVVVTGGTSGILAYIVVQYSSASPPQHPVGSTWVSWGPVTTSGIWSISATPPSPPSYIVRFAICGDFGLYLCYYSGCSLGVSASLDPKVPLLFGPGGTVYAALPNGAAVGILCNVQSVSCSMKNVFEVAGPMIGAMAVGADGTLYGNAQGTLFAAYTTGPIAGKTNWQTHFYQQASTGVTLSNATLIAGTWKNTLFGVCSQGSCTGLLSWQLQLPQSVTAHMFSSVVASSDGSRLYIGSLDHSVYCVALV
jgi:outer membrane protein assembly factor BamB